MLLTMMLLMTPIILKIMLNRKTPKPPIFIEETQAIFQKLPQHKKKLKTQKNITDVPDGDANYFLTMMLLMTPKLLMMILAPQNPQKPHIH